MLVNIEFKPIQMNSNITKEEFTVKRDNKNMNKFSGMLSITVFCILIVFFAWMEPWERSFESFVKLSILMIGGFLPLLVGGYHMASEKKNKLLDFINDSKKGVIIFLIVWAIGMLFLSQLVGSPFGNISY